MQDRFTATTQYNDWNGTIAADNIDGETIREYLKKEKKLDPGEFLIGIDFSIAENSPGKIRPPYISCLKIEAKDFGEAKRLVDDDSKPLPVERVEIELSLEEFIGLFKRFNLILTNRRLDLIGRKYEDNE